MKSGKALLEHVGGCRYVSFSHGDYRGPMARIEYDNNWLHIVTDDFEGAAMLNIEALPKLRQALAQIAKELRAKAGTK